MYLECDGYGKFWLLIDKLMTNCKSIFEFPFNPIYSEMSTFTLPDEELWRMGK